MDAFLVGYSGHLILGVDQRKEEKIINLSLKRAPPFERCAYASEAQNHPDWLCGAPKVGFSSQSHHSTRANVVSTVRHGRRCATPCTSLGHNVFFVKCFM